MMALSRLKVIAVLAAVLFGILFTLPNVLPAPARAHLPGFMQKTLNLGLDLRGGSRLLMEVDAASLQQARLTALEEDLRNRLSTDNTGFDQLAVVNNGVEFHVLDPAQTTSIANSLRGKVGGVTTAGQSNVVIQPQGADRIRVSFVPSAANEALRSAVSQSIEVIRRRIDATGTKEPAITPQGDRRIVIEAPGESDPEKLKALIGKTARLTFQMVDETVMQDNLAIQAAVTRGPPPGDVVLPMSPDSYAPGQPIVLKKAVVASGDDLTAATQSFDQNGAPAVSFRFGGVGSRKFGAATSANVGKRFAIVLDDQIISAPVIQSAITGGSGEITGIGSVDTAANLALLLRSGALPAKLNVIDQRTVGAELGQDSINKGMISLGVGAVAILVFIMLAYGLFGVFAALALIVNVLMILAAMSVTQATLTFPGIAGLILTLAVAVDANVLIYERIRDEAHAGRPVISAIDHGYSRALVSILDANITSAISALIMLFLGAGPVKGFAWTLLIGVFTSVFTAVVITQVLIALWFRAKRPKILPIA